MTEESQAEVAEQTRKREALRRMTEIDREAREAEMRYEDRDIQHCIITDRFANNHPKTVEVLSKHQLAYSIAGLVLGLACVIGGIILFLNGIVGSTSWTAKVLGAESNISDAAPGAVLFIVGLFVVLVTRYKMHINK